MRVVLIEHVFSAPLECQPARPDPSIGRLQSNLKQRRQSRLSISERRAGPRKAVLIVDDWPLTAILQHEVLGRFDSRRDGRLGRCLFDHIVSRTGTDETS